jgi:hypothetical protein
MKHVFVFFLSFCFSQGFCQHNDWCWGVNSLGNGATYSNDIHTDNSGNVYITGGTRNMLIVGNDTVYDIQTINNSDVFIAKYDSSGNALWVKKSENSPSGHDYGTGIITDNYGNIYVTGYFQGSTIKFDTITLTNTGTNCSNYACDEIFIVKYDSLGNIKWAKSAQGSTEDHAVDIACDTLGNIIITGYFESPHIVFDTITLLNADSTTNYYSFKIFTAKYDASGNIVWAKGAGSGYNSNDQARGIAADDYGNVYVTGSFNSHTINFDSIVLYNTTNQLNQYREDLFIVKYNAEGNIVWAKKEGGNYSDRGEGITIDGENNLCIVGSFSSDNIYFGTHGLTNNGTSDAFVCKYDSSGNALWAKSAGVYSYTTGNSIALDTSNNVFISGGFTYGSNHQDPISFGSTILPFPDNGYYPSFIAKYDAEGDFIHATTLKTSGGVRNSITSNSLNQLYFGGGYGGINCSTFYLGDDTLPCPAIDNAFFLIGRYDCTSTCTDDTVIITFINDTLYSTEAYSYQWFRDGVVVNDAADQYYFPEESGNYYVLVADASGCTYISNTLTFVGINEITKTNLTLYPNPATNTLTINTDLNLKNIQLQIHNAQGQLVMHSSFDVQRSTFDISSLNSGIYFLTLTNGTEVVSKKFVKE